jgi:hypothetical protein
MPGACVLVIDGLGWKLLEAHAEHAPFLAEAARGRESRFITAGFPATTSASLGSLGTGLPPGEHGLVGYTVALPGFDRAMNLLQWELYGIGPPGDLRDVAVPEEFQPHPTVAERAALAGVEMTMIGPSAHAGSGLTRAILRGGRYVGADTLQDLVLTVRLALDEGRTSVYAYHPFLDTYGHLRGQGSEEWCGYLSQVDAAAGAIAEAMPPGFALVVTADHGMVNIEAEDKVDVADVPELMEGVRVLAGEARARHVVADAGAEADVLATWTEVMGGRMWVVTRQEAVEAGWFGPRVEDRVLERMGHVIAAARVPIGVFQREVDPLQAGLVGHHGSLTEVEQLVPFIVVRR